jgi:hypothetical protein
LQGKQEQHKFSEIKLFFLLFFKIDPQEETTRHDNTRVESKALLRFYVVLWTWTFALQILQL